MSELTDQIAKAELALHRLMTGSMVEELQHGERRTRFVPADAAKLRAYIAELKAQAAGSSSRSAIGVQF